VESGNFATLFTYFCELLRSFHEFSQLFTSIYKFLGVILRRCFAQVVVVAGVMVWRAGDWGGFGAGVLMAVNTPLDVSGQWPVVRCRGLPIADAAGHGFEGEFGCGTWVPRNGDIWVMMTGFLRGVGVGMVTIRWHAFPSGTALCVVPTRKMAFLTYNEHLDSVLQKRLGKCFYGIAKGERDED
jgi:hypothetical protein